MRATETLAAVLGGLDQDCRIYLRPTGFTDLAGAPRLAGGLARFTAVELIASRGGRRVVEAAVPADTVKEAVDRLPPPLRERAERLWSNIVAPRPPLPLPGGSLLRFDAPLVMGIVNVTPDSFSDGGRYRGDPAAAVAAARAMVAAGAAIVDIGGESTRPGAAEVSAAEERARVEPVLEALAASGLTVSIDTRRAEIMRLALERGVSIVNDVSALTFDPEAAATVAQSNAAVVLMHHKGTPATMARAEPYADPALATFDWLEARVEAAVAAGIDRSRIIVDPGVGFSEGLRHDLALLGGLSLLHGLGCPILLGASRKRFIGRLGGDAPASERLGGSVAALMVGLEQGVQIVRVHDVAESVQAVRLWEAVRARPE